MSKELSQPVAATVSKRPFRRLYDWFVSWAEKPDAEKALAGFAFAESSFFPVPPDPLLIAMVFIKTNRFVRYAVITTVASVLGGILGYVIGIGLFESIGHWLIETYHLQDEYASLGRQFQDNNFLAVFTAALTPIPYKIITISAGAFKVHFASFIMASALGRGTRFFAVAALARYLGKNHRERIERSIDILSLLLIGVAVVVLLLIR